MGNYLKGKAAIVTGSGQGVGRAIAKALSAEGARVVTNNRKPVTKSNAATSLDVDKLALLTTEMQEWVHKEYEFYAGDAETTAHAIRDAGGEAVACFADIADYDEAKRLVDICVKNYGTVDIVINVAANFGFSPIETLPKELWDRVMAVKPTGYFHVIRHAIPYMQAKGWGRIINCSSPAFMGADVGNAEYVTSNAASVGLTWALATEVFRSGITANAFTPVAKTRASVDLEIFAKTEAASKPDTPPIPISYDDTPSPELFAPFLAWLAGEESKDINGTVFFCAGNNIARWNNPFIAEGMHTEGGWSVEKVREQLPTFFKDYHNINYRPPHK